jgi:hypothetical protein
MIHPQAQQFITFYAAFLKRQGMLPMYVLFHTSGKGIEMLTAPQSRFVTTPRVKEA